MVLYICPPCGCLQATRRSTLAPRPTPQVSIMHRPTSIKVKLTRVVHRIVKADLHIARSSVSNNLPKNILTYFCFSTCQLAASCDIKLSVHSQQEVLSFDYY